MNEIALKKWYEVCDKCNDEGYTRLTSSEQVWINVRALIDSTENGGIISYFYNSGADSLHDCLHALDLFGADIIRAQLERVSALFPSGVPDALDERNRVIDSWDTDEAIGELLDDIDKIMFGQIDNLEEKLSNFLTGNGLLASQ